MRHPSNTGRSRGTTRLRTLLRRSLSYQIDQPPLRLGVAVDVSLCRGKAGVPGKLLDIAEAATRFHNPLGCPGDEGTPTAVAARTGEPPVAPPDLTMGEEKLI